MRNSFNDNRAPLTYPVVVLNPDNYFIAKAGAGLTGSETQPEHLTDLVGGILDALAENHPDAGLSVHRFDWLIEDRKTPLYFVLSDQSLSEEEVDTLNSSLISMCEDAAVEADLPNKYHEQAINQIFSEESIEVVLTEGGAFLRLMTASDSPNEIYEPSLQPKTVEEFVDFILEQKDLQAPDGKPCEQDTLATYMSHMHNITYTLPRWEEEIYPLYLRRFEESQ